MVSVTEQWTDVVGTISQVVSNGRFVADMHNYWVRTTGTYYFPGMYTAILPMTSGIYAIRRVLKPNKNPHFQSQTAGLERPIPMATLDM